MSVLTPSDIPVTDILPAGCKLAVEVPASGTKGILAENFLSHYSPADEDDMHRSVFRGQNLGNAITADQLNAIQSGTFENLWLGDYWLANNRKYRIVDFNYFMKHGYTPPTNHIVVMADEAISTGVMHNDTTTGSAWGGCYYASFIASSDYNIINTDFGANKVMLHYEYLPESASGGLYTAQNWYSVRVVIPSEVQMFGTPVSANVSYGSGSMRPGFFTLGYSQFALFRARPEFICPGGNSFWLRDVVDSTQYACVDCGTSKSATATASLGHRPYFLIG